jgi:hypothetical protein
VTILIEKRRNRVEAVEKIVRADLVFQGFELQFHLPTFGAKMFDLRMSIIPVRKEPPIEYLINEDANDQQDAKLDDFFCVRLKKINAAGGHY